MNNDIILKKPDEPTYAEELKERFSSVIVTIIIFAIWIGIMMLFIKLDVGGFGSDVMAPILHGTKAEFILPEESIEEQEFLTRYREEYPRDYSKRPTGSTETLEESKIYVKDLQDYCSHLEKENEELQLHIMELEEGN